MPERQRRSYSKRQKLTAVIAADMTSTLAASEATGIPRSTLRWWLDDPSLAIYRHKAREHLGEEMAALARMAAEKLGQAVRDGKLEPRDLITALGVTTDKMQLLSGHPTERTETRDLTATLTDHERATLRDILDDVLTESAGEVAAASAGEDAG